MSFHQSTAHGLSSLQKVAVATIALLTLLTFLVGNLHALLWQQSAWLVSTVLPAVVVELTNSERIDAGIPRLVRNTTLDEAARMKAEHMAKYQYFSHYSPDGVSPWYWFKEAGYVYAHAGENLAIHFTDSTEVVSAWMNSPTHKANIVGGQYTEIGVGTAKGVFDGFDTVYVVQLFGTPAAAPVAPVAVAPVVPPANPAPVIESALAFNDEITPIQSVAGDEVFAEESLLPEPEPVAATEEEIRTVTMVDDVVVVESTVSTSSGLAIASIVEAREDINDNMVAGVMTKPQQLFTAVYLLLAVMAIVMLIVSAVLEARRFHFVQVAYSITLLFGMSGLWWLYQTLTSGAVIA